MVLNEVNQPQRNKFHRTSLAVCNQCSVGSNRIEWGHQQLEMERDNHLSYFDFSVHHDNIHIQRMSTPVGYKANFEYRCRN